MYPKVIESADLQKWYWSTITCVLRGARYTVIVTCSLSSLTKTGTMALTVASLIHSGWNLPGNLSYRAASIKYYAATFASYASTSQRAFQGVASTFRAPGLRLSVIKTRRSYFTDHPFMTTLMTTLAHKASPLRLNPSIVKAHPGPKDFRRKRAPPKAGPSPLASHEATESVENTADILASTIDTSTSRVKSLTTLWKGFWSLLLSIVSPKSPTLSPLVFETVFRVAPFHNINFPWKARKTNIKNTTRKVASKLKNKLQTRQQKQQEMKQIVLSDKGIVLSAEQMHLLQMIVNERQSVFFTGPAGKGFNWVLIYLRIIVHYAEIYMTADEQTSQFSNSYFFVLLRYGENCAARRYIHIHVLRIGFYRYRWVWVCDTVHNPAF